MNSTFKKIISVISAAAITLNSYAVIGASAYGMEEVFDDTLLRHIIEVTPGPMYDLRQEGITEPRLSKPFKVYDTDGLVDDKYIFLVFRGGTLVGMFDAEITDHSMSHNFRRIDSETVDKAYSGRERIGFFISDDGCLFVVTEGGNAAALDTDGADEQLYLTDSVEFRRIELSDFSLREYSKAEWEHELKYFTEYGRFSDPWYEMFGDGGGANSILRANELEYFKNSQKAYLMIDCEKNEAVKDPNAGKSEVKVKLYLSRDRYYVYTLDLCEKSYVPIPEILEQTGLTENDLYKELIGVIISAPDGDEPTLMRYNGYSVGVQGWLTVNGKSLYVKRNGELARSTETIDNVRYVFNSDGVCVGKYSGWTTIGGKRFYYLDGVLQHGWVNIAGEVKVTRFDTFYGDWYYIDKKKGMLTGTWKINDIKYTFDEKGRWNRDSRFRDENKKVWNYSTLMSRLSAELDKTAYGGVYAQDGMCVVRSVDGKAEELVSKMFPNANCVIYKPAEYSVYDLERAREYIASYEKSGVCSSYIDGWDNVLVVYMFAGSNMDKLKAYVAMLPCKDMIEIREVVWSDIDN